MDNRQTLTTGEIATHCGVNFRTVIRWIKRGHLKAFQLPGRGDNRVTVADFVRFLRDNNMPVPREFLELERRVLIVDDDPPSANAIQRALRLVGFESQIAHDGFQAGAMLETYAPTVMTLDLSMPGLHGTEVTRFVRSKPTLAHTRILVVSAMPREELEEAVRLGADDFLQKPFESSQLVEKVTRLSAGDDR